MENMHSGHKNSTQLFVYFFAKYFIANCPQSVCERILKIDQYLAKIWRKVKRHLFMAHGVQRAKRTFVRKRLTCWVNVFNCFTARASVNSTEHRRVSRWRMSLLYSALYTYSIHDMPNVAEQWRMKPCLSAIRADPESFLWRVWDRFPTRGQCASSASQHQRMRVIKVCEQLFIGTTHLRATERHLSYGITQWHYVPPNTVECAPP